jgi:phosphoglycerate dehydrogenase-like enzyme
MDGFDAEHRAFLSAIRDGAAPRHAIAALAPSLFLAEQIERGHQGKLMLPYASAPPLRAAAAQAVLVTDAGTLQNALTGLPAGCRFVSLSDVCDAPEPNHHVRAAIMGRGSAPLSAEVLDKLPNLGAVGVAGLSLSRYQPEDLLRRGITLFNASAAYAETVADFAFALAVLGRRRAFVSHEVMRQGGWGTALPVTGPAGLVRKGARSLRPLSRALGLETTLAKLWRRAAPAIAGPGHGLVARDLREARVGLVGWGANARAFARRLRASGAQVLVWSEHATDSQIEDAIRASLEEVLAADIVSLHRGLTSATRHFLGEPELARLRPGTVLINVARGALIEPEALVERLRRGDVFACLDTYDEEPPDRESPLRQLPNVFLTSHIGGGSPEMHQAAAEEVVGKVAAWLQGARGASIEPVRFSTMT